MWDYVALDSGRAAERVLRRIDEIIVMLAERPDLGRNRDDLGNGIRSFPIETYVVFYRHRDTSLDIVRILHAARDITPEMLA